MKKAVKFFVIILSCAVCLSLLIVGGLNAYLRISYSEFYKRAETYGDVPGISDGFIQQGISYVAEAEKFISCGYMNDGSASRVYIFDDDSEDYVILKNADGAPNSCHAGGLSCWKDYVIICGDNGIYVYSKNDIISGGGATVLAIAYIDTDYAPAFCYIDNDMLYAGEFYRDPNYITDSSHHIITPSGEQHHALLFAYNMDEIYNNAFSSATPVKAYSIVDLAQGMCITKSGDLCISTSYAVSASHIYVYDVSDESSSSEIIVSGSAVPLYYLDSTSLKENITLFPMCEELVTVDGKVYIINESASEKYIFGKFTGGGKIYSLEIN